MASAEFGFNLISSQDLEGVTVFDPNGDEIGEIDHLMIDCVSGRVRYAVMAFGGFLGLGHSHYPLPWSSLTYDRERGAFVADVTEQQLHDAPEFSDDSWSDREWERRVHEHYHARPYWDEQPGGRTS
ncbi:MULTISPECIES: PRC-barrel domain-containing protein [Methylosinus]|uniref:Photosystem reaction center subunit H n=1 Tax=Methylosinus trichosporium (strain ATCC 35070 / NCIMB 11131 / UNIQEM 75 / OB3b) TaxID=595536 RepID=A0A2D2CWD9_METT3|nr:MULTISPECIES: PRC-barrel domain-containing protein [Methylosinus]ATQ66994.1 photosystem reaction center subunit H [Methylosinus trichosporium OB3b]OBS54529.1 photosystem reaction center subunit H [Methylosinus sp. 3S-1]